MNRRSFFKGLVGATGAIIVPDLILPEHRIWSLGGVQGFNAPPHRGILDGDDASYVQWHIDNGAVLPPSVYHLYQGVSDATAGDGWIAHGCDFQIHHTDIAFTFNTTPHHPEIRGSFCNNIVRRHDGTVAPQGLVTFASSYGDEIAAASSHR